jgi:hypothetical protein
MSGGGGGGIFGPVGQAVGQAAATPTTSTTSGAAYAPAKQGPVYQPNYQQYQPQQYQPQQQMPSYQSGLQAAMMHMMQQYSRPMMRAPVQQGLAPYNSPALNYRPPAVDNTSRVAPSVELQQRLAAEEAARKQAEQDAYNAAHPAITNTAYDGG